MTFLSTPFSLETVSATRSISLLISLPHPETMQLRFASVEFWNQICLVNLIKRYRQGLSVHIKGQRIALGSGKYTGEIPPPTNRQLQFHFNGFADIARHLLMREQRTIHAR